jgi:hypothetical protein
MAYKNDFLNYIKSAYERESSQLNSEIDKWKKEFDPNNALFGYFPPGWPLIMASVAAFLYEHGGVPELAITARDILLKYREWTSIMPKNSSQLRPEYADGINPIEPVFQPLMFIPAVSRIKSAISAKDLSQLKEIVTDSEKMVWRFPEWGGHNRAMLRAAGLALAAQAFPENSQSPNWVTMADELAEESWGRWSLEDTQMYQSHWLRAMIIYSEARGKPEIADFVQPHMVLRSMVQLLTPLGNLPDYGDSHWMMHSQWEWLACLEWGARTYRDPTMKWAANRIWEQRQAEGPNLYGANVLSYAWRWADDSIGMQIPGNDKDAIDDLILKKLVFRTGFDRNATYGLVNYRDEGDYGLIARDYLRTTLAVSAEKMHHGHGDEGSFSVLIHKGSVLLHESGYRESPPGGIYRSAVYHNRLAWRDGLKTKPTSLLEFLRGNGHYNALRTQRLYQTRLFDAEISRIRMQDERDGIMWDRSLFFLPSLPCWVVIDTVFEEQPILRTFSSMWWTMDLLKQGTNWFETHVSHFVDWQNSKEAALLLVFPLQPGNEQNLEVEHSRRSYQDETVIENTWSAKAGRGNPLNFATVIWPHNFQDMNPDRVAGINIIRTKSDDQGIAINLDWNGESHLLTTLNDLRLGWIDDDIRPRYNAEKGLVAYGPVASDAAFTYTRRKGKSINIGLINGTRLDYAGHNVFASLESAFFQENATQVPGYAARFRWEGEVTIK